MRFLGRMLKILWISSWAILATVLLFVPITASGLLSSTGNLAFTFCKLWAWIMLKVTGIRPETKGKEKIRRGQSYVIIANHQSHYDALTLLISLGIQFRWVIKKEILKVPLFGYALYASKNIFIDRSTRVKSVKSVQKWMNRPPPGVSIIFFAEGARSPDGTIQEFKKGGFAAALENGLPILPVTINGSARALPKGTLVFNRGPVQVVIGDPIETGSYTSDRLGELRERTKDIILSNFNPDYPEKVALRHEMF